MMRHSKEVKQVIMDTTREILSNTKIDDGKLYVVDFKARKFLSTYKRLGDASVLNVLYGTMSLEGKTIDKGAKANTIDHLAETVLSPRKPKRKLSVKKTV